MRFMSDANLSQKSGYPILCHVTPWYFRRMGMMAAMLAGFGLYFLYDGQVGYPQANRIADKQVWFEEVVLKSFDEARVAGKLDVWVENARNQGWPTGRDGEPPRWISYAAQQGWPEKPHRYTPKEIHEQFWWGGASLLGALAVGVMILMNRSKVLRGDADGFLSPEGIAVKYGDVFRVDKRPWDTKGLAYVWYRSGGQGAERRAVIDDLKYEGAVRVLNDLMASFRGEFLEKVSPAAETPPKP
jgi:hypothetical protein